MGKTLWALAAAASLLVWTATASAISITQDNNAMNLAQAMTQYGGQGVTITGATLSGGYIAGGASQTGTYTNLSGTYGVALGPGIVLSSGNVMDFQDGPNLSSATSYDWGTTATAAQEALLDPITGNLFTHYDVVQLDITFDMQAGYDTVYFNTVFGSEEYPEWVGTQYIDGFGLYVNGTNIAFVDGLPVNINHPAFKYIPGTELDGIMNDRIPHTFGMYVGDGSTGNTLTLIIADASDHILSSTVYLSQLGGESPPVIPEPATMLGLLLAGGGLARYIRKRRLT